MKKHIKSSLCSAFIVPGLGQVLNNRILKGLILMALVFILIIAITVNIIFLIIVRIPYVQAEDLENIYKMISKAILQGDLTTFWILIGISAILWIYSIVDAFIEGLKIEKGSKENPDETLSG